MQSYVHDATIVRRVTEKPLAVLSLGIKGFIQRHCVISSLYILGLIAAVLGNGVGVGDEVREFYEDKLAYAGQITSSEMSSVLRQVKHADDLYYKHKGWFSCDEICTEYYNRSQALRAKLSTVKEKRDLVLHEGRQAVGVWSSFGISDLRSAFWQAWNDGKEAARRITMMDAMFIGLSSITGSNNSNSDNSFFIMLIRVIFQFLANLTVGLFTALIIFIVEAYYIITSYGPTLISGLSLFLLTVIASTSIITTAIGSVFGGTVGGIYLLVRNAEKRALQEAERSVQHLHYD
jgi:hypothetical protein